MAEAEKSEQKQAGRFKPGQSGNPRGKPPGTRNPALVALERIGQGNAEGILQAVIIAARGGDMQAARIILDRVWPARRGAPVSIDLPAIKTPDDVLAAMNGIAEAVGSGMLTPEEGETLMKLVEATRHAIDSVDLARRIEALEQREGA
jgi:hypothetical protein